MQICGTGLGLRVRRHRLFEANAFLMGIPCAHGTRPAIGVYGDHANTRAANWRRSNGNSRGIKATSEAHASDALGGVEWMNWDGMTQCIPPAYTEYIGSQLLDRMP
jgi:DNA (cytosine-5)-methyltransferase 1